MNTFMETVKSNIRNFDNSVNYMARMFTKFMREMNQGVNLAPAVFLHNIQGNTEHNGSTTVAEAKSLSGP